MRRPQFFADDLPLIAEISFGTFAACIGPFALPVDPDRPRLTDSTVITIKRSTCFGRCPDYTLTLWGSGRVEFDGREFVCARGRHTAVAVSHLGYEIKHDHNDVGAPRLSAMEDEIDRVAGTRRWLPIRGEDWRALCRTPEGTRPLFDVPADDRRAHGLPKMRITAGRPANSRR